VNGNALRHEVERCRHEIAAIEHEIRAGNRDVHGVVSGAE
jgi:hypothetical protein